MTSADRIAHLAERYTLVEGDLYRHGANGVLMRCITREEGCRLLPEVHGGECGNYASLCTLVGKAFRYGFYWPTTLHDAVKLVKTCKACQFGDRGHDYLGPRDFCCAVTAHEELRRVTVPRASQRPCESWVATYQPCCTTASESQHIKTQKGCTGKGCWPHPRVRSLSRGGPEGHCRYPEDRIPPHISIKSTQRLLPPGWGQLRGRHVSPWLRLPLPARGSTGATTCPRGSGQLWGRHVSLGRQHPHSGAEQLRSCHASPGLCGLQANKQISPDDPAIMISIGACTRISSNALRDNGCSTRS
jgi:hypothetical protein